MDGEFVLWVLGLCSGLDIGGLLCLGLAGWGVMFACLLIVGFCLCRCYVLGCDVLDLLGSWVG